MIFDKMWRLERRSAKSRRAHTQNIKGLKLRKASREEIGLATQEAAWDYDTFRDAIESTKSFQLIGRANRLGLPTPSFDPDESAENQEWERGYTGGAYLTRIAQTELRSRIRQEEKEQREVTAFWVKDIVVPMLSSVVGILGATMGLIALLHKK